MEPAGTCQPAHFFDAYGHDTMSDPENPPLGMQIRDTTACLLHASAR